MCDAFVRFAERLADAVMSASNPDFFGAEEKPALAALSAATAWRIYGGGAERRASRLRADRPRARCRTQDP